MTTGKRIILTILVMFISGLSADQGTWRTSGTCYTRYQLRKSTDSRWQSVVVGKDYVGYPLPYYMRSYYPGCHYGYPDNYYYIFYRRRKHPQPHPQYYRGIQRPQPITQPRYDNADTFTDPPQALDNEQMYMEYIAEPFAAGDYVQAATRAKEALRFDPESSALGFVYSQILLSNGLYSQSASVLRDAILKMIHTDQPIYYPIDFYPDIRVLHDQVDALSAMAKAQPRNTDLQLILGYQYWGLGRTDLAIPTLNNAKQEQINTQPANILINIITQTENTPQNNTTQDPPLK